MMDDVDDGELGVDDGYCADYDDDHDDEADNHHTSGRISGGLIPRLLHAMHTRTQVPSLPQGLSTRPSTWSRRRCVNKMCAHSVCLSVS